MAGYTKLFGSILDSTVWQQPLATKVVWITMLAMADRDGVVEASVPGLALRAGVSREDCERALATFTDPDPDSRTRDHEGRRIAELHGGWRLLNYEAYRDKGDIADVRKKAAARQQRYRERQENSESGNVTVTSRNVTVTPSNEKSRQASPSPSPSPSPSASASAVSTPAKVHAAGSDHTAFIAFFHELYLERIGSRPTWGAKQAGMVKTLLGKHPLAELKRRAVIMFTSPPAFLSGGVPDLGTLVQHIDKFTLPARDAQRGGDLGHDGLRRLREELLRRGM